MVARGRRQCICLFNHRTVTDMPRPPFRIADKRMHAVLLLLSSIGTSVAAEIHITCPEKLTPDEIQVIKPPSGWTPHVPVGFWLRTAAPMYGPPSEMATLQEDSSKEHGNTKIFRWKLAQKGEATSTDDKWMACFYGAGNDVIISKRIDSNVVECTVTHTKHAAPARDTIDIRCK